MRNWKKIFFVFLFCFAFPIFSEPSVDYQNKIIREADIRVLAKDRYWRLLGHYKKKSFGRIESEIDSPDFFLAKNGKTNPEVELAETIKRFFDPITDPSEKKMHPQCEYPARYKWLKSKLKFDGKYLIEQKCGRFEQWMKSLNPNGIRLVFSSFYMNNPASIFGHSLLKINTKREDTQDILDYGVNFAALTTGNENPALYAFLGLIGGYKGVYSILPYYIKVNEYNDHESRDLWEYELNFNDEEVNRLMLHLWEMGKSFNWYYFFDENCSYQLLGMLEIARPSLQLTNQFPIWVMPAETIRLVASQENLVAKRIYRPSLFNRIKSKLNRLNGIERKDFEEVFAGKKKFSDLKTNDPVKKSLIADTLLDALRFKKLKSKEETDSPTYRDILLERSKLPTINEDMLKSEPIEPTSPESIHNPARVKFGVGIRSNVRFTEFAYRPNLNDLLNFDAGFPPNSELQWGGLRIRKYDDQKGLQLEEFNLIKMVSLSQYNLISQSMSNYVDIGAETVRLKEIRNDPSRFLFFKSAGFSDENLFLTDSFSPMYPISNEPVFKRVLTTKAEVLTGYTFQSESSNLFSNFSFSALLGGKANYGKGFTGNLRFGPAISTIIIGSFGDFKFLFNAVWYEYSVSNDPNNFKVSFGVRYAISKNQEFRIELKQERFENEGMFSYSILF